MEKIKEDWISNVSRSNLPKSQLSAIFPELLLVSYLKGLAHAIRSHLLIRSLRFERRTNSRPFCLKDLRAQLRGLLKRATLTFVLPVARSTGDSSYWFWSPTLNNRAQAKSVKAVFGLIDPDMKLGRVRFSWAISDLTIRSHWPTNGLFTLPAAGLLLTYLVSRGRVPSALEAWAQYTHSFLAVAHALQTQRTPPRVAVFSNEHSPDALGYVDAMRAAKIPLVFVQHALGVKQLEALRCDFAIFKDNFSKKIVAQRGELPRFTAVYREREENRPIPEINTPTTKAVTIVIYLGPESVVNFEGVEDAIIKLRENPRVARIVASHHPKDSRKKTGSFWRSIDTCFGLYPGDHIALVANSGVSLELAKQKISQAKCFAFDTIARDIHGWVERNLLAEVEPTDLAHAFWESKDFYMKNRGLFGSFDNYPAEGPVTREVLSEVQGFYDEFLR